MSKRSFSTVKKLLSDLFYSEKNPQIVGAIDNSNMETLHYISVAAAYVQIVSLLFFIFSKGNTPASPSFWTGVFSVSFCIVFLTLFATITRKLSENYKHNGKISHIKATFLIVVFYIVLSAWGIRVDIRHYRLGEQMLTFYIVQFCFLTFLMLVPRYGNLIILLTYIALFIPTIYIDNAKLIQPNNHFVFALLAIFANTIQYSRAVDKNKDKIGISELNNTLRERSVTDDLTKLKNRYALREEFEQVFGKNIYITMADIDYFKKVNDTYGHLVGDELLTLIANTIKQVFSEAYCYRYGGDEFLIILETDNQELYESKLTQWNKLVSKIKIQGVQMEFACSSGYAFGKPKNKDEYRSLLKQADDKLYKVKKKRKA